MIYLILFILLTELKISKKLIKVMHEADEAIFCIEILKMSLLTFFENKIN